MSFVSENRKWYWLYS